MDVSRRRFLANSASIGASIGATVIGASLAPRVAFGAVDDATTDELLDEGYDRIAARFPDRNVHASNHAAMVVETLATLGRHDAIEGWLDRNLQRFDRGRTAARGIDPVRWREGLADPECYPEWQRFFREQIDELGADAVLRTWLPRFAPALASVAAHGVIRTAHAGRAIAARDTPARRFELATGLAYWAVNYEELPWDRTLAPKASVAAALEEVAPRASAASPTGSLVGGLRLLRGEPAFAGVAGWVDPSDPSRTLGEMARAFAGLYLANPGQRVAFCHAVTAPSALRLLTPWLDAATLQAATRYAWQTAAGIYVVYGGPRAAATASNAASEPPARDPAARASIVDRAVERGRTHGIKLAEACLREHALAPDPVLLLAAEDAATSLDG